MTPAAVDWEQVRGVVFDVDGTLYDQRAMRLRMAAELALGCLRRPATLAEARLLAAFRRLRERLAEEGAADISRLQYARTAERLGVPAERVESVVEEWILRRPLRHLEACRSPGARRLFAALRRRGLPVGVWSDYPAAAKLQALGLTAEVVISADQPAVDRLKPHPAGLTHALERLGLQPGDALMVGDRDDRDGAAARRLGCAYRLLSRRPAGPHEIPGLEWLLAGLGGDAGP